MASKDRKGAKKRSRGTATGSDAVMKRDGATQEQTQNPASKKGPFPNLKRAAEVIHQNVEMAPQTQEQSLPTNPIAGMRGLDAITLSRIRPHIVNLNQGRFSSGGKFKSTASDVDTIFLEHLPKFIEEVSKKTEVGSRARIVLWAHGGLNSEETGLAGAASQIDWWMANDVYPIFFVWETGFWETIQQLLFGGERQIRGVARDLWDHTTDPAIELLARRLGGPQIWSGMKRSAENAFHEGGGGTYTLDRLGQMLKVLGNGNKVELHAIGHSAGSIFHSELIARSVQMGLPAIETLHLLAPAVTNAHFKAKVAGSLGKAVKHASIYTMKRDIERDDSVGPYRKSLLYLIHFALEPERREPVLGLESSIREDDEISRLFGLDGSASEIARVIWSVSHGAPDSSSQSTTHGGFDNDPATMESLVRRVLNRPNGDIKPFPSQARSTSTSLSTEDLKQQLEELGFELPTIPDRSEQVLGNATVPLPPAGSNTRPSRKRALCVGIDEYRSAPLAGCVNDAKLWARTFSSMGFDLAPMLFNSSATRNSILQRLGDLITDSRAGDVVAFQYAGHGTQLEDIDGDEFDGDTPGFDEALVPFDFEHGAFIVDDDLAELFALIPPGVNVTCFMDCCHSGTINRLGLGGTTNPSSSRRRYLPPTESMQSSHRTFRESLATLDSRKPGSRQHRYQGGGEILFAACLSSESAWESNGQGDFTRHATAILSRGVAAMSHEEFQRQVVLALGAQRRQNPELRCPDKCRHAAILRPHSSLEDANILESPAPLSNKDARIVEPKQAVKQFLKALADAM